MLTAPQIVAGRQSAEDTARRERARGVALVLSPGMLFDRAGTGGVWDLLERRFGVRNVPGYAPQP